jgi:hypothetical protein
MKEVDHSKQQSIPNSFSREGQILKTVFLNLAVLMISKTLCARLKGKQEICQLETMG